MKLSHDWLKDFVEIKLKPEKLGDKLTMSGLEVESLERVGKDVHYELGVTPNRSDCLSVIGVAREVAALTERKLKNVHVAAPKGRGKIAGQLKVVVKSPARCPRYTARMIEGVRIGPSPSWMVKRLAAAGVRSINNVVDATNYVMMERGQPLHAFDARMVHGGKIEVRLAGSVDTFKTLDGVERSLEAKDLLIGDAQKPIALAGIMGGENSEVSDDTTTLILESAYFEPSGVRRTSKRLGLSSESSHRFERGVDPNGVLDTLHRLTEIIVQVAGGTPTADWIDVYPRKIKSHRIALNVADVERVVGIAIPTPTIRRILKRLGFSVAGASGSRTLRLGVPTYRPDVTRPIDVIEEIVRIYGYHNVPETEPTALVRRLRTPKSYPQVDAARNVLVDLGYSESVLSAFENEELLSHFFDKSVGAPAAIANPLSQEEAFMRTHLMPGLMTCAQVNLSRQRKDLRLFALQRVYRRPVGNARAPEPLRLAVLSLGRKNADSWSDNETSVDFYDIKGAVEAVFSRLGLADQILFQRGGDYDFLVPGSYATVLCSNERVGWVGRLHPQTAGKWNIEEPLFGCELDFETLASHARQVKARFRELSRYPYVQRDLAIVVDANIPNVEIEQTISKSLNTLLSDVRLFDVYRGKGIPEGKKSLAYAIRYASDERTLTDDEVNDAHALVIAAVQQGLGAELR